MRKIALLPLSVALATVVGAAGPSGLLAAGPLIMRPRDEEEDGSGPLIIAPQYHDKAQLFLAGHRSHSSHSSHRSHSSHYSGRSTGWADDGSSGRAYAPSSPVVIPPPKPPQPAFVSLAAFPGGRIFVDGTLVGYDATGTLRLNPGSHDVRIENRFLGTGSSQVSLVEGQTGLVVIKW
ncbi:MAG: hypothetical protein QM784_22440 [Polyangiaceae bacterium]